MRIPRRLLIPIVFSLFLSACDNFGTRELKPGESTAVEVRDRMGQPSMEWKNDNGTVTWEYPKGPEGKVTFMVTIGADNILRAVEQVLSEPYFAKVEKGMSRDEVRRLLGRPAKTGFFPLKKEEIWDWRIEGQSQTDRALFHVHFAEDGRVVGTSRGIEAPLP